MSSPYDPTGDADRERAADPGSDPTTDPTTDPATGPGLGSSAEPGDPADEPPASPWAPPGATTSSTNRATGWAAPDAEETRSGWHRVNVGHLVMGMAFLCFVGAWALVQADVVTGHEIRWLLPIPWLVAGAVGLVTVAVSSARRHGVRR